MVWSSMLLLFTVAFAHGSYDLCTNTNRLKGHITTAFNYKRSYLQQEAKDKTFQYITGIFDELAGTNGESYNHTFEKTHKGETRPATNAILMLKGSRWGTEKDQISLVGSHYDSVTESPGVDDNGSGVSALLEVAQAVTRATCTRLNTIIFVAFDWEEYSLSGSRAFVYKHLVPAILQRNNIPANRFTGAFIMDSILNYEALPFTQVFPDGAELLFPDAVEKVAAHEYAGDFIASIGRQDDRALMQLLQKNYNGTLDGRVDTFRVIDINIPFSGRPSNSPIAPLIRDLFRSDHYHFWDYYGNYTNVGLKAVFLTDSTEFRGYMKKCYHKECDNENHMTPKRLQFMASITNALTNSLLELSTESEQCRC